MTLQTLFDDIINVDLCTSCGACAGVCPENLLHISVENPIPTLRSNQIHEIGSTCGECTLCLDVCPGKNTGVTESELRIFGRNRNLHERWTGIGIEMIQAQSCEEKITQSASAGGAATTILTTALRTNFIDAVLVIGRDSENPWKPEPKFIESEYDLLSSAQAIYCIAPNLQILSPHLPYKRIAVVGLPCQISSINKMKNNIDKFPMAEKIVFTIELACSSNTKLEGTTNLIEEELELPLFDVTRLRYRDGNYPGEFTVTDKNSSQHTVPFPKMLNAFRDFKTFRCHACPDWWSGLADISIADGDPNILKTSIYNTHHSKSSLVMIRTQQGMELVELAEGRNELKTWPASFIPEENLGLQRKRHKYLALEQDPLQNIPRPYNMPEEEVELMNDDLVIESMNNSLSHTLDIDSLDLDVDSMSPGA